MLLPLAFGPTSFLPRHRVTNTNALKYRNSALAAMAFGVVGIVLCLFLEDLEPKMTPKIEVFLENDRHASKNKFH